MSTALGVGGSLEALTTLVWTPQGSGAVQTVTLAVGPRREALWATEGDCAPVFTAQAASFLMGILGRWFRYITCG